MPHKGLISWSCWIVSEPLAGGEEVHFEQMASAIVLITQHCEARRITVFSRYTEGVAEPDNDAVLLDPDHELLDFES